MPGNAPHDSRPRPRSWHSSPLAVLGFLLPNFLGLLCFTLVPIVLSLCMTFTNWSLKPSVNLEFVGLRNYIDLLGLAPVGDARPGLLLIYCACAVILTAGVIGWVWARAAQWRGVWLRGVIPAVLVATGCAGLWILHREMWLAYECRDLRFWKYLFNTGFLLLAVPFSVAGSLVLALLLNDKLPLGPWRRKGVFALVSILCAVASLVGGILCGYPDAGVLAGILWLIAALAFAFNAVAFRTLYYLPTFTAGVALMILWQALYNPETGPINQLISMTFSTIGIHAQPPQWLASVTWAKPAMIIMLIWTAIGGTNMLLYLAGLSNIPRDLLDAAEVDGAGPWNTFRHVTWPQLAPTTFFITVTAIIGGLQAGFEQARVMTLGGPAGSTTTLSYYIYQKLFEDLDLGYAATISWVLFGVIFVATMINWRFTRGFEAEV